MFSISPSNIFQMMPLLEKYFRNCQAIFGCCECEWVKGFFKRRRESFAQREIEEPTVNWTCQQCAETMGGDTN